MQSGPKYLLSVPDFAEYEGVDIRTIKRRAQRGELVVTKMKGRRGYRKNHPENRINYTYLNEPAREKFLRDGGIYGLGKTEEANKELSELKLWQREEADKRQAIIRDYINAKKDLPRGKITVFKRQFAKSHSINYRSLDRWEAAYKSGGYHGLVPAWNAGNRERIIAGELARFVEDTYLKPFGPTMIQTYELLVNRFRDKNPELPCYRTVVAWINEKWPKGQQLLIRNKEEWDRLYSPYVRRDWTKVGLNEVWVGDAKQIDVACLFRNRPIFPWFTAFLDAKSRKFTGWIVTPTPDSWAIAQSFVYGVGEHGVPGTIYVDRGKSYKSKMIAGSKLRSGGQVIPFNDLEETAIPGIFRELGCEIFFAAGYNAREKLIESNFRMFTERLNHLPGNRGPGVKSRSKKCEHDIKTGKIRLFEELSQEVDTFVNERNARPHSGTGRSPNSYYKDHKFAPISKEMLAFLLMDVHIKKVMDATVTVKGMVYRCDELWRLAGESVTVRRDPQDLREAAIIYKDKLFGFARLEMASHYRDAITLESVKTASRVRQKIRKYRQEFIEKEGVIYNPVKYAAELDEQQKVRARDIRPANSKVISLHKREAVARQVVRGLKEEAAEPEQEVVAVGEGKSSILARLNRASKEARAAADPRRGIRLVEHLDLDLKK